MAFLGPDSASPTPRCWDPLQPRGPLTPAASPACGGPRGPRCLKCGRAAARCLQPGCPGVPRPPSGGLLAWHLAGSWLLALGGGLSCSRAVGRLMGTASSETAFSSQAFPPGPSSSFPPPATFRVCANVCVCPCFTAFPDAARPRALRFGPTALWQMTQPYFFQTGWCDPGQRTPLSSSTVAGALGRGCRPSPRPPAPTESSEHPSSALHPSPTLVPRPELPRGPRWPVQGVLGRATVPGARVSSDTRPVIHSVASGARGQGLSPPGWPGPEQPQELWEAAAPTSPGASDTLSQSGVDSQLPESPGISRIALKYLPTLPLFFLAGWAEPNAHGKTYWGERKKINAVTM